MNITKTNIDELNAVIKLHIVKEDYEERVNNVLKDYRKKAKFDGFRPGKVPAGLIKKMYGTSVLADEINKLISENLMKYIVDSELNILGEPLPNEADSKKIDWENDKEFELAFDIAMSPEFTLNLSKRDKMNFYKIKVDEDMIQKTIDNHVRRFGENVPADVVEEKSLVKGEAVQLDAEGNVLEGGITKEDALISLEYTKEEEAKKFFGANANQIITFNPKAGNENVTDLSYMLGISKEEAETLESDFQFTIKEITNFVSAEINEDLFAKAYPEQEVKTEEDFKAKIVEEIEAQLVNDSNYKFELDAKAKFVKKAKITLPEAFLKRWIVATNDKMTEEQVEADFAGYSDEFRWQLIKDKLIKENELTVTEEQIMEFAKKMVIMQFQQYGMASVPEEHLENYAKNVLENKEEKRRIYERKGEELVFEHIKNAIKVEDSEVTKDEFNAFFEKKK